MAWWRREDADNPAWPGLVDIFAFTLVFILLLWFANNLPQKLENLKQQTQDLGAQLAGLKAENQRLQEKNQGLNANLRRLDDTNQQLTARMALLEESNRDLASQKQALEAGKLDLDAKIRQLGAEYATLKDIGRKDWEELLKLLQGRLAGLQMIIIPHPRDKEIEIQGKPRITFETLQYELSEADKRRLQLLAPVLSELRRQKKFFITINGTADPREVHNGSPPRNNTELSALRAAAVGAAMENAAPGLGQYLKVTGLGVKGRKRNLTPGNNPDRVYREYRTVSLVLKIDVAALMQEDHPGRAN